MHVEIEERILDIDSEKVIKKLEKLNAIKVGECIKKGMFMILILKEKMNGLD